MTIRAKHLGGHLVPAEPLPFDEGAEVLIETVEIIPSPSEKSLGDTLMEFVGKATGLPPDAAVNHDHYLYGTPKK